jgi:tRNA dimethylallyltransferase
MSTKTCIIIAGPTAVGKTSAAIELAQELNTEIISADSRQCYKEMRIGVARPSEAELRMVRHHFIANHSIAESISAASFEKESLDALSEIFKTSDYAVVCGGTGLYINALMFGMDAIPEVDARWRQHVIQLHEEQGMDALRNTLLEHDPTYPAKGDINNPNRMMRALEVVLQTGKSLSSFQSGKKESRPFQIDLRIMEMPRDLLYERIERRVDMMIEEGLEEEVRSLIPYRNFTALQTVGYSEFFDYFDGKISKNDAINKIKQHTRNYAKRQVTWFKRMKVE